MYFYCVYIFHDIKFLFFKGLKQIWNTLFLATFITTQYGFSYGIRTWLTTHVYVNFVVSSCVMWFFEFLRNCQFPFFNYSRIKEPPVSFTQKPERTTGFLVGSLTFLLFWEPKLSLQEFWELVSKWVYIPRLSISPQF